MGWVQDNSEDWGQSGTGGGGRGKMECFLQSTSCQVETGAERRDERKSDKKRRSVERREGLVKERKRE